MSLLEHGGTLVVIGAKESNVGSELWRHPQLVFMDGVTAVKRGLPSNAKGVVFTRFMGHSDFAALVKEAKRRNITVFPVQGTGALKRTISQCIERKPAPPEFPATAPIPVPPPLPIPSELITTAMPSAPAPTPAPTSDPEPTLTTWQAANLLGVTPSAIQLWGKTGKLHPLPEKQRRKTSNGKQALQVVYRQSEILDFKARYTPRKFTPKAERKARKTVRRSPARTAPAPASLIQDASHDLIELVDNAIAALQLIREVASKSEAKKTELVKRFERMLNESL